MHDDLLTLHEASDLVGVAPSTLRRWGDAGRVPMQKTLGGHRRFVRTALLAAFGTAPDARAPLAPVGRSWSIDPREIARQAWHTRLAETPGAERMRGLGQRLLGLLIQFINRREDDQRFLAEARGVGAGYGREAQVAGIALGDAVEMFLFFRSSFARLAAPLPALAQPADLDETAVLRERIDRFMDATLLGVVTGYESQRAEQLA